MPHLRPRYLSALFNNAIKLSPLVGVLGHRQVGKTTFLEQHCNAYHVVDRSDDLMEATSNPAAYLKSRAGKLVGLDECQVAPKLFPELKEWVRIHKSPGQFILSGSVRFSSREAIRESLTGRIVNLELLPMTISEQEQLPLSGKLLDLLSVSDFTRWEYDHPIDKKRVQKIDHRIDTYLDHGGLPGSCFLRDKKQLLLRLNEQLGTILDRDIRLVRSIQLPLSDIQRVIRALADTQGQPLDLSELRRRTGTSIPTLKKLLYVFEAVFLIRAVPIQGGKKGTIIFFEDMGEKSLLQSGPTNLVEKLTHLTFTHLRTQFTYLPGEIVHVFQYRTRGGAYIPLAYTNQKATVGFLPLEDFEQTAQHSGSIQSFLSTYANSKVVVLARGKQRSEIFSTRAFASRVLLAPYGEIL